MTRSTTLLVYAFVAAAALAPGCTERTADQAEPTVGAGPAAGVGGKLTASQELQSYWQSQPDVRSFVARVATFPDQLAGADAVGCAAVADELDLIARPVDLVDATSEVPDEVVMEALLEQQAAVSSVMAACRGDAPISLEEALGELRVTNDAVLAILREAGLR